MLAYFHLHLTSPRPLSEGEGSLTLKIRICIRLAISQALRRCVIKEIKTSERLNGKTK